MKQYDHIEYYGKYIGLPIYAFDKLDGSNIRVEFSHKRGFYKYGTRKQMIDATHQPFGVAVKLFNEKYADKLSEIFRTKEYRNIQSFVCFLEFVGKKSAFGQHDFENDKFDIVLFDIDCYKKGKIPPKQFIKDFEKVGIPSLVYQGNLSHEFIERVKTNEFNLSEGVICKGKVENKKDQLLYCKIKTNDWFERLRSSDTEKYYEELKDFKKESEN